MPSPVKLGNKAWSALRFLIVSVLMGVLVSGLVIPLAAVAGITAKLGAQAIESLPADLETPPQSQGSHLQMADGSELATIYDEDREYVPLDKIAKIMQTAQVAIEDDRFYEHGALDFRGTMRALFVSGGSQGGSTITQQYVKNVQIEAAQANGDTAGVEKAQERTLARKVQELRYAIAMEKRFSKDQILERYLNIASYGGQTYGVEAAAKRYFNKHATDLNLSEAAMIAGIVQNPSAYNPAVHPQAAMDRRNVVINRMLQLKLITDQEATDAKAVTFDPSQVQEPRNGCVGSPYPQLCQYALNELYQQTSSLGSNPDERRNAVQRLNMTIKLSIDPKQQTFAEQTIAKTVTPTDPVIATFAMVQPGTGKILIMAQSRPEQGTQPGQTFYNYNASRDMGGAEGYQAGSTFKIFNAANALDMGVPANKTFVSPSHLQFRGKQFTGCDGTFNVGENYAPQNDGNESFGAVDMYKGAQNSINAYFLQLEQASSICGLAKIGDAAGVDVAEYRQDGTKKTLAQDYGNIVSLTLGPVEVAPLSMANAYATFAARGKHCDTSIIGSITSRDGKAIATKDPKCEQVIKPEVADAVNAVFSTVVTAPGGSGHAALVPGYDQAGKTGTTDTRGTVWYDGYTPDFAAASMLTTDKTDPYFQNREQSLSNIRTKAGVTLYGYGSPDCTNFFTPIWRNMLTSGPGGKFTAAKPEVLNGKQAQVPAISGTNPDADEKKLKDAGFATQRTYVASNYPRGTYLGIDKTGQQVAGTTITLLFSNGPGNSQPSQQPTSTKS